MRSRADLDGGHYSREQLDRHRGAVQVGDHEIGTSIARKGKGILLRGKRDRAHTGVEPVELIKQGRISIWSWLDEVSGAGIGCILVDQRAVHLCHLHEEWIGQWSERYHNAHIHQTE